MILGIFEKKCPMETFKSNLMTFKGAVNIFVTVFIPGDEKVLKN